MEFRKFGTKRKKNSLFSKCPLLLICIVFFLFLEAGSAVIAVSAGKMTLGGYLTHHMKEPGWTEYLTEFRAGGMDGLLETFLGQSEKVQNDQQMVQYNTSDVSGNQNTFGCGVSSNDPHKNLTMQPSVSGNNQVNGGKSSGTVSGNELVAGSVSGNEPVAGSVSGNGQVTGSVSDNEQPHKYGVTNFLTYTPVQVSSPYFQDRGKTAQTTDCNYQKADDSYFSDAAFIGDSRTLGLHDYSGWKNLADFYCDSGFSLYQWSRDDQIADQETGKKTDFLTAFSGKKYGKIYIMVGMNDLGYGNTQQFQGRLQKMISELEQLQPNAMIYLMANLHMAASKSNLSEAYNNVNLNDKNAAMAELADGIHTVYLDANPLFTDEQGNLKAELTFDGFHLYATGYVQWADFIKNHTVII